MYSLFYSLIFSFQTIQYSYRFLALNIMAQMYSPCSIPLCEKTVTKTRLELNAEVMGGDDDDKSHGNSQLSAS
jgi:hypothetical protein